MEVRSIAEKNDKLRREFDPNSMKIFITSGVSNSNNLEKIINIVRVFEEFTPDNDPYHEHDMAFFDVSGEKYFFKFDYYDDNYEYFKEDGNRVLTVGRASEY